MKITVNKKAQLKGHNASIFALAQGHSPQHFLSAAGDGWVAEWDLEHPENGQLLAQVESQIFSISPLYEQQEMVIGNMNGGLHWVNLVDADQSKNIAHHQKGIFAIQQYKQFLITAGGSGLLTKWSMKEKRSIESLQLSKAALRCMVYDEIRNELAIGASDNAIYFVNPQTFEVNRTIQQAHQNSVFSLAYHPDKQHLLSGSRDAHLTVWDLNNLQKKSSQPAHWFTINDIAFNPQGTLFATASRDKTIKIWDAQTYQLLKVLETIRDQGHLNSVNTLFWSAYHNYLISGSDDRSMIIWEIR